MLRDVISLKPDTEISVAAAKLEDDSVGSRIV